MPTGYTAAVADGTVVDLRSFALQCARGMGALVTMRDEPWDAPIPDELKPSTAYYDELLTKAQSELGLLSMMSDLECAAAQERERAERAEWQAKYAEDTRAQRARYEAMLAKVEAWGTEAEGIRDFMLSQLRQSIEFDCRDYEPEPVPVLSASEWRAARMAKLTEDIRYYEAQRAAEIARTAERNRWLSALRDSLAEDSE